MMKKNNIIMTDKKRIWKEGFKFSFNPDICKECSGNCCNGESGTIFLNKAEMKALSEFLGIPLSRFTADYLRKFSYKYSIKELKINNNYACVFYDEEQNICSVYPVRPGQCRTFPFWNCFKKHPEALLEECPGVVMECKDTE